MDSVEMTMLRLGGINSSCLEWGSNGKEWSGAETSSVGYERLWSQDRPEECISFMMKETHSSAVQVHGQHATTQKLLGESLTTQQEEEYETAKLKDISKSYTTRVTINIFPYIHLHHLSSLTHSHNRPLMTNTLQVYAMNKERITKYPSRYG